MAPVNSDDLTQLAIHVLQTWQFSRPWAFRQMLADGSLWSTVETVADWVAAAMRSNQSLTGDAGFCQAMAMYVDIPDIEGTPDDASIPAASMAEWLYKQMRKSGGGKVKRGEYLKRLDLLGIARLGPKQYAYYYEPEGAVVALDFLPTTKWRVVPEGASIDPTTTEVKFDQRTGRRRARLKPAAESTPPLEGLAADVFELLSKENERPSSQHGED